MQRKDPPAPSRSTSNADVVASDSPVVRMIEYWCDHRPSSAAARTFAEDFAESRTAFIALGSHVRFENEAADFVTALGRLKRPG